MVGTTSSGKVAGRSGRQSDPRANLMAVEVADAMESEVCQFPQARPASGNVARMANKSTYLRGCQAERHKSDGRPRD
jgi:hypothetical protein